MVDAAIVMKDLLSATYDFDALTWQPFRDGVQIYRVHEQPSGAAAALLRYVAGARVPRHAHPAPEHLLILRGSQRDERGVYNAGTFVVNLPGSEHDVISDDGCIVLAIWVAPVRFIGGATS